MSKNDGKKAPPKPTESRKVAFEFQRGTSFKAPPEDLVIIGLDTKDGPEHPLYKEDIHKPLDEAFVQNVDENGVIQPISVRKNGDKAEVTWGRTRVRAAREVNRRRKKRGDPPIIVEFTLKKAELKTLHAMSVAENFARKKFSAVEEAREMEKLCRSGYEEEEVAVHFACSVAKVKNRRELLTLAPQLIAAVESGKLFATTVLQYRALPHDEQVLKVKELLATGDTNTEGPDADEVPVHATETNGKNGSKTRARATTQAAKAALGKRVLPNKRQLKLMIEHGTLTHASANDYAMWMIGEKPASKVKGLTSALRAAGLPTVDGEE